METRETNEWLKMNFPVGSGPEITVGHDLLPSDRYYMEVDFSAENDYAYCMIYESMNPDGLRTNQDEPVVAFTLSQDLLLTMVRTISAIKPRHLHRFEEI